MRDWGIAAALEALPEWVHLLLAGLTLLGDPLLVLGVASLVYWFAPFQGWNSRRDAVRLAVATLVGLAAIPLAKAMFALARPPDEFHAVAADGFGFPSGHATAAASLAVAVTLLTPKNRSTLRLGVAGGYVALIAVTRVGLGVHYVGDVLAGAGLGALCAVIAVEATRRRVKPGLAIAVGIAVVGAIVTGLDPANPMTSDASLALGGTVGAGGSWTALDSVGADLVTPDPATLLGGGLIVLAGAGVALLGETVPFSLLGGLLAGIGITIVPRVNGIP
jgi:membrane-associated phospholipid phosphatase